MALIAQETYQTVRTCEVALRVNLPLIRYQRSETLIEETTLRRESLPIQEGLEHGGAAQNHRAAPWFLRWVEF